MRTQRVVIFSAILAGLAWTATGPAEAADFERQIAPLLARRCLGCHAGDEPQGGLDLTTRAAALRGGESGPALVPRNSDASPLWQRIASDEMPPKAPLPAVERELLREWIQAGADWDAGAIDPLRYSSDARAGYDWWSLQPLQRPGVPNAAPEWSRNPIDRFIAARRSAAHLTPAEPAERRVLIRRLSFDLLGLPPTAEQVAEFVADSAPDAYERLVERCLSSPHYGERWARHWLDVVRFGESNGFERDLPRENAWHYRDWVIEALNRDLPYDEFVRWQLAADALDVPELEARRALGFLVAGPHDTVIPVSVNMRQAMRQDELEDLIGVVGQTFLGLTINCARCHDHKFDPVTSREYYQLVAVFAGIDHAERTLMSPAAAQRLVELQSQIARRETELQTEAAEILAAVRMRTTVPAQAAPPTVLPAPLALWDFTRDLQDRMGQLHGTWHGTAQQTLEGIVLDGKSYVSTPSLPRDVTEKTLEVRLRLADLEQRGGGALSLQTPDGRVFDAIVFGEQQPKHWMAGSNFFERTSPLGGIADEQAQREFVTLTIVYRADGTIAAYRNGQEYGRSYMSKGPVTFVAGQSQVLFGLRHTPSGGNRFLKGTIASAKLFATALTAQQVAASASAPGTYLTEADLLQHLAPEQRTLRLQRTGELERWRSEHASLTRSAPVKMYTAAHNQPSETRTLRRGNVTDPGDVVSPAGLSAVVGWPGDLRLAPDALEQRRRRELANWITDRRNPLFARVMVNRLWHYHFGAGLVATPNDLGFNGGQPSHPELLEWLAREFVDGGYSLKQMHRLMVTSATYQQSSQRRAEAIAVDADNRLLWRMSPRRLDAESLRDALLVVCDELNTEVGGKGYVDFNSYFFKGTQFYDPITPAGFATQRRTIYRMWARGGRNPFLDTFDCPDPSAPTPNRSATTTPLQALSLLNNPLSRQQAERLAQRLREAAGENLPAQIDAAYQRLYARDPADDERAFVQQFVNRHGLVAACLGLLNASEFVVVD